MTDPLTKAEQETIISKTDDERYWTLTTSNPVRKRQARAIAEALSLPVSQLDAHTIQVRLPLACVTVRLPRKLSNAERQQALRNARAQREEFIAG